MSEFNYTPDQEAWLQDLEKTRAKQTEGSLRDRDGWCCLGRGCKVLGIPAVPYKGYGESGWLFDGEHQTLPAEAVTALRLRSQEGTFLHPYDRPPHNSFYGLTGMNDNGWSFKRIASYIRANPKNVFIEQRGKKQ